MNQMLPMSKALVRYGLRLRDTLTSLRRWCFSGPLLGPLTPWAGSLAIFRFPKWCYYAAKAEHHCPVGNATLKESYSEFRLDGTRSAEFSALWGTDCHSWQDSAENIHWWFVGTYPARCGFHPLVCQSDGSSGLANPWSSSNTTAAG